MDKYEYGVIRLVPVHKSYIWGGEKLKKLYEDTTGDLLSIAESWILSAHKDGQSIVCGGEYDGLGFGEYLEKVGTGVLGENCAGMQDFPILIKLIDAKSDLSVQVHPDDNYARLYEGQNGKTEMWYVIECDEEASIYYGFKDTITKEEAKKALENGTFTELLNSVPVHKGDAFFIPAGTVHAIGKGSVICEVQQNSNVTYRVFDYNRTDRNGNKRELHIQRALDVMDLCNPVDADVCKGDIIADCKYFKTRLKKTSGICEIPLSKKSFLSICVTEGYGIIYHNGIETEFKKGDSFFVPAQEGIIKAKGDFELILTTV